MNRAPIPLRHNRRPIPGGGGLDRENPFIYVGDLPGVRKARARAGSLIAPIDADPELFRWPVEGLSVTVVGEPEMRVFCARLASVLIRDGAELVACVSEDGPLSFHKRGEMQ